MTSLATRAGGLRSVTRPFDPPDDLLDGREQDGFTWLHEGHGLVAAGTAAIVDAGAADALLANIEVDDPLRWPGTGPIAVGALGFDPRSQASLAIPSTVVGRAQNGRGWITTVGSDRQLRASVADLGCSARVTATRCTGPQEWQRWVATALRSIRRGDLEKVVLAREVLVDSDQPFSVTNLLRRLRSQQPGCFVHFADGLIGASPELLVRRVGATVESQPMAGTARVGTDELKSLRESGKNTLEHRIVVNGVAGTLAALCESLDVAPAPLTCTFSSVGHLATPIRGTLSDLSVSALALARILHPTPAVAGTPLRAALRMIARLEPRTRGRYAGPVGWVDSRGDGEWALALRGAELEGSRARLRAGAGIVTGSDPDAEWAETEAKLEPMLDAFAVNRFRDPRIVHAVRQ